MNQEKEFFDHCVKLRDKHIHDDLKRELENDRRRRRDAGPDPDAALEQEIKEGIMDSQLSEGVVHSPDKEPKATINCKAGY